MPEPEQVTCQRNSKVTCQFLIYMPVDQALKSIEYHLLIFIFLIESKDKSNHW